MKRIIYGFLLALASLTVVTSCTEEDVRPTNEIESSGNGGGNESEGVKKS